MSVCLFLSKIKADYVSLARTISVYLSLYLTLA